MTRTMGPIERELRAMSKEICKWYRGSGRWLTRSPVVFLSPEARADGWVMADTDWWTDAIEAAEALGI